MSRRRQFNKDLANIGSGFAIGALVTAFLSTSKEKRTGVVSDLTEEELTLLEYKAVERRDYQLASDIKEELDKRFKEEE